MTATTTERRLGQTDRRASSFSHAVSVTHATSIEWKSVTAGALTGFATTLVLTTLGTAIGITATVAADSATGQAVSVGAAIWWLLTVLATGIVAGRVIAATAERDDYSPVISGAASWSIGVIVMLSLLAVGVGSIIGGLGGGAGTAMAQSGLPDVNTADSMRIASTAARASSAATWGLLLSQVIGLVATMAAARPAARRERSRTR